MTVQKVFNIVVCLHITCRCGLVTKNISTEDLPELLDFPQPVTDEIFLDNENFTKYKNAFIKLYGSGLERKNSTTAKYTTNANVRTMFDYVPSLPKNISVEQMLPNSTSVAVTESIPVKSSKHYRIYFSNYSQNFSYLVKTSGCEIPKVNMYFDERHKLLYCGYRRINIEKIGDNKIRFLFLEDINFCFAAFLPPTYVTKFDLERYKNLSSIYIKNGTEATLKQEIIMVFCGIKHISYTDIFHVVLKKTFETTKTMNYARDIFYDEQTIEREPPKNSNKWHLLLFGMDSLSRMKAYQTMPITIEYMKSNSWLDFEGFNKIASNSFPNLAQMFSNTSAYNLREICSQGIPACKKALIWDKAHDLGYITAYGEDARHLRSIFRSMNKNFSEPPVDHHLCNILLLAEKTKRGNLCAGNIPSSEHVINFALDLLKTYGNQSDVGLFATTWISSLTHTYLYSPAFFDLNMVDFLKSLENISFQNVMERTFIFFISDHGTRYGRGMDQKEAFYENRLPVMFAKIPDKFKEMYPNKYTNIVTNQKRLVTPSDIYFTINDIITGFEESNEKLRHEACPKCNSIFTEISTSRTCPDAGISDRWCACTKLEQVEKINPYTITKIAEKLLQRMVQSVVLNHPEIWFCVRPTLKEVVRLSEYRVMDRINYLVVAIFGPTDHMYEILFTHKNNSYDILNPVELLTHYDGMGECAKHEGDKKLCACDKIYESAYAIDPSDVVDESLL